MPIPHDYKAIDTSPKSTRCERVSRYAVELLQALALDAFIYCAAVFCFSL
jgi:hypothetical protein